MTENITNGLFGLKQLEERCNVDLVDSMRFQTNGIGYEWIEVKLKDGQTYDVNLRVPNAYKITMDKLINYNQVCTNARLILFIGEIIAYKRNQIKQCSIQI